MRTRLSCRGLPHAPHRHDVAIAEPFRKSTKAIKPPIAAPIPPHKRVKTTRMSSPIPCTSAPRPAKLVTRTRLAMSISNPVLGLSQNRITIKRLHRPVRLEDLRLASLRTPHPVAARPAQAAEGHASATSGQARTQAILRRKGRGTGTKARRARVRAVDACARSRPIGHHPALDACP